MRKIIIGFLVVFMLVIVGITAYFIKIVYYTNNDNEVVVNNTVETTVEETTKKPKYIGGEKVEEYVDEYGIKTTKYSDGVVLLEYPEDVTTWNMQNKDVRTTVIYDAMLGRVWDWWTLRNEYPITENFFKEWDENGWKSLEVLFPGYKHDKKYNSNADFGLVIDDFEKDDKEGIAHATIRSKFYDTQYDFKYYLDDGYKLDKIEYVSQEVVKDYTKEVEKDERIYLMLKDGDDIHEDNEYILVLQTISTPIEQVKNDLDKYGIIDEIKEKKIKEDVLPIDNNISYLAYVNKKTANYEKKEVELYVYYDDNNEHRFEKYLISFDYNNNYYLTKYEVVGQEEITIDEYKKNTRITKFSWEDKK